jgi:hypothetical protein
VEEEKNKFSHVMVSLGQYVAKCWASALPAKPGDPDLPASSRLRLPARQESSCVEFLPRHCDAFAVTPRRYDAVTPSPRPPSFRSSWDIWFCRNCCCPFPVPDEREAKRRFRLWPKRTQIFDASSVRDSFFLGWGMGVSDPLCLSSSSDLNFYRLFFWG